MIVQLTTATVTAEHLVEALARDDYGAIVTFTGTIRNTSKDGRRVTALRIEPQGPDAQGKLEGIAEEVKSRWKLEDIIIRRRTGTLKVGEVALVVAIASRNRIEAFEACQFIIDRIKEGHVTSEEDIFESSAP